MKVVHINWCLRYGGIETMLVNIANSQVKLGAEVHVCIIDDQHNVDLLRAFDSRIQIHFLHREIHSKSIGFIIRLNRLLIHLQPDAIHLHDSRMITFLWSKRLRRVASMTLHALPTGAVRRSGLIARVFPFLFKSGNVYNINRIPRVFAISEAVKDALWKDYCVKSTVISNGIMTQKFKLRTQRNLEEKCRIVMVSRLDHEKKGQDLLIEAAAKLNGIVSVDFIGDGNSREYLKKMVNDFHAESYISFLGMQSQAYVANHLADYDLFVQASRWEGFGLTVAEAMAARVPVLVSHGQGPAEVTCGNRYGWIFDNGNVDDLIRQLEHILTHYDTALVKAEKAMQYVRQTYDVSVTARKYLELYTTEQI